MADTTVVFRVKESSIDSEESLPLRRATYAGGIDSSGSSKV
jgi:hypothetical protein